MLDFQPASSRACSTSTACSPRPPSPRIRIPHRHMWALVLEVGAEVRAGGSGAAELARALSGSVPGSGEGPCTLCRRAASGSEVMCRSVRAGAASSSLRRKNRLAGVGDAMTDHRPRSPTRCLLAPPRTCGPPPPLRPCCAPNPATRRTCAAAAGLHGRADRLRPGQVLQHPGRLDPVPRAADQRHPPRQRP
jgi:hypothetical protein